MYAAVKRGNDINLKGVSEPFERAPEPSLSVPQMNRRDNTPQGTKRKGHSPEVFTRGVRRTREPGSQNERQQTGDRSRKQPRRETAERHDPMSRDKRRRSEPLSRPAHPPGTTIQANTAPHYSAAPPSAAIQAAVASTHQYGYTDQRKPLVQRRERGVEPAQNTKLKHFYTCKVCHRAVGSWTNLGAHASSEHGTDPPDRDDAVRRASKFMVAFNAQGYSTTPLAAQQVWDLARLIQTSPS